MDLAMAQESDTSLQRWGFESGRPDEVTGAFSGDAMSLTIALDEFDDARFVKSFRFEPGRRYTCTVRASGRDIVREDGGETGATICVHGSWAHSMEFDQGTGTFDGDLSVSFRAPADGRVDLGLRVGYWSSQAKGSVTFSELRIVRNDDWELVGTGRVRLDIPTAAFSEFGRAPLERFCERMSAVYFAMARLYGSMPFGGAVVTYEATPDIDAYAYAGNPVSWNLECAVEYFRALADGDNAGFGAIHEMGRNFDMTPLTRINCEMMANFALCYAVETLGLPINFDGEFVVGKDFQDGFYRRNYEASIAQKVYSHDGLLYCILRVKDAIGWRPFEDVMRKIAANQPEFATPAATFRTWMEMLGEEAHMDVRETFRDGEFDFILAQEVL
jgi:hypothetical protein